MSNLTESTIEMQIRLQQHLGSQYTSTIKNGRIQQPYPPLSYNSRTTLETRAQTDRLLAGDFQAQNHEPPLLDPLGLEPPPTADEVWPEGLLWSHCNSTAR
jgi:hypothetical protein